MQVIIVFSSLIRDEKLPNHDCQISPDEKHPKLVMSHEFGGISILGTIKTVLLEHNIGFVCIFTKNNSSD